MERMTVEDEHVMVLGTLTHTMATTTPVHTPSALHLMVGDRRITRLHLYEDTLTVYKAFAPLPARPTTPPAARMTRPRRRFRARTSRW
jgi:ketosteroid isomerase-like protein